MVVLLLNIGAELFNAKTQRSQRRKGDMRKQNPIALTGILCVFAPWRLCVHAANADYSHCCR